MMRIVTVNVPEAYIEAINKLIGNKGIYPSRSELIRCAVREFLIKELKMAKNLEKYEQPEADDFDEKKFVRIPVNNPESDKKEFKTYKIIKRLEF